MRPLDVIDLEFLAGRGGFLPPRPWPPSRVRPEPPRLASYARILARELGLDPRTVDRIALVAPWHDVGKVFVDPAILGKPGPLNGPERAAVRRHPVAGAVLLAREHHALWLLASLVALTHHERWDGSGYPFGLRGPEIPVAARIVAVADTYDALRSERSYKPALDHATARRILLEGDERTHPGHYDPAVLAAFERCEAELASLDSESAGVPETWPEAACF